MAAITLARPTGDGVPVVPSSLRRIARDIPPYGSAVTLLGPVVFPMSPVASAHVSGTRYSAKVVVAVVLTVLEEVVVSSATVVVSGASVWSVTLRMVKPIVPAVSAAATTRKDGDLETSRPSRPKRADRSQVGSVAS